VIPKINQPSPPPYLKIASERRSYPYFLSWDTSFFLFSSCFVSPSGKSLKKNIFLFFFFRLRKKKIYGIWPTYPFWNSEMSNSNLILGPFCKYMNQGVSPWRKNWGLRKKKKTILQMIYFQSVGDFIYTKFYRYLTRLIISGLDRHVAESSRYITTLIEVIYQR